MRPISGASLVASCLALSFLTGCSGGSSPTPSPTIAITATSGGGQSAAVGAAFANALVATVTSNGSPASGVTVTFTAPSSQPSGTFAGAVATDTETTNSSGVATAKAFTAGTKAGSYTISASATGATSSASFSLSNSAGPAAAISATAGGGQSATVSTAFTTALQATVVDSDNNPVSGVAVTFTAPASGASGTFTTSGTTTETDTTGSNGVATASAFKANSTAGGPYAVTANFSGNSGTAASFSLTNNAAPVPSITVSSGSGQSATVSTAFANKLVAVVMTNGTPTSGVSVTFTAPSSGASGTFSNGTATETDTTNSSGMATSSTLTANATAGAYTVAATTSGATAPANFSETNTSPVPSIAVSAGSGQSAAVSTAFANKLVAVVTTSGSPASGVSVTFTAPSSGASGTFSGGMTTETDTTNSSGLATSSTFTANATAGAYTVTANTSGAAAPANFSMTNTAAVTKSNYTFYMSGQEAANASNKNTNSFYSVAGVVQIDSTGKVLGGEQDYNDGDGITSPQPSGDTITSGTLVTNNTGHGTLTLVTNNSKVGVSGTETFSVEFVNLKHALIMPFDGSATGSGSMDLQTAVGTSGNFAYTLTGTDSGYNQIAEGGVFTITGGNIAGTTDINDNGKVATGQSFSGTVSAPDSFGRGTVTTSGSTNLFNYYIVGPEVMRIIEVNTNTALVGSAFGQGTGSFTSSSLGTSVLALQGGPWSGGVATLAQFTTSNLSSNPSTLTGVGDGNELGNQTHSAAAAAFAGTYTIAANGVGTLTISGGSLGNVASLNVYMTDPHLNLNDPNNTSGVGAGALVLDMDLKLSGATGIIVPQTDTSASSVANNYVVGAQDEINAIGSGWYCTQCEFDFIAQGTITGGVLTATGDLSDPLKTLTSPTGTALFPGTTFSGTLTPDAAHPGRYSSFTLSVTMTSTVKGSPSVVVYQANGGQLFWMEVDSNSLFSGPLEQQGSLTGLP